MIKVIDLQGCNFLEDYNFKNKRELRNRLLNIGQMDGTLNNNEIDLRRYTLNELLEIWNLDLKELKGGLKNGYN